MQLSKEEITKILKKYALGDLIRYQKLTKGLMNHNWLLKTKNGKYVLRAVAEKRSLNELNFEQNYLEHIRKSEFPYDIPKTVKTSKGQLFLREGKNKFWIYSFIEGHSAKKLITNQIKQVATMMAKLHKISEKVKQKKKSSTVNNFNWLIKETRSLRQYVNKKVKKNTDDLFYLKHVNMILEGLKAVSFKRYDNLPKIPIHADINRENLLFNGKKLTGLIDFDNCKIDTPLRDITLFLLYECRNKSHNALDVKKAKTFMRTYNQQKKIDLKEIRHLPSIAMVELVDEFAWSYQLLSNKKKHDPALNNMRKAVEMFNWVKKNEELLREKLTAS